MDKRDRRPSKCRCLQETLCFFFLRQQQFDLTAQAGVFAACNTEECLPLFRLTLQSRVEEHLYSLPTFLVHGDSVLAVSQCYSTSLATVATVPDSWDPEKL